MPDCMSAHIEIGGALDEGKVKVLAKAIEDDAAMEDFGSGSMNAYEAESLIWAADGKSTIKLYDDQAAWGEFSNIEETCRELGLAYRRYHDGKYEYDGEIVAYFPEWDEPRACGATQDGEAYMTLEAIEKGQEDGSFRARLSDLREVARREIPFVTIVKNEEVATTE